MRLEHGGVRLTLPTGWEARARLQPSNVPGRRGNLVLHAATIPLPADRGDFGSGVVETLASAPIGDLRELHATLDRVIAGAESHDGVVDPSLVRALAGLEEADGVEGEFAGFLTDIASAVAAVVETAPWRRELAEAILRWGGEGIRTRRLEAALDAESAPDVEGLLRGFAGDVARLRELARDLPAPVADPALLDDPDRLGELEALAARAPAPAVEAVSPRRAAADAAVPAEADAAAAGETSASTAEGTPAPEGATDIPPPRPET
ncbi:MAG: hypothetical protein KY464_15980 [Gemmatimonadetes bacterium]|nr:hypothetical protein [Gemmatimonadota bacterium]